MGSIVDAFTPDARVELTVTQLIDMCNYRADLKAKNKIMLRGYENKIDPDTMLILLGKAETEKAKECEE